MESLFRRKPIDRHRARLHGRVALTRLIHARVLAASSKTVSAGVAGVSPGACARTRTSAAASLASLLVFLGTAGTASSQVRAPSDAGAAKTVVTFVRRDRSPARFEIVRGVMVFHPEIGGRGVWAIVDNRMGASVLDTSFAAQQGLLGPEGVPLRTPTGTQSRQRTGSTSVVIPGQIRFDGPLHATDLSFPSSAVGRPIAFVLGKEYFDNLEFLVSNSTKTFQVGPSGALNVPEGTSYAPLLNSRPQIAMTIGGQRLTLTLDLGYNGDVALGGEAWKRLGLDRRVGSRRQGANLQGQVYDVDHVIVPDASIGPFAAKHVDVSTHPILPQDGDGLVGFGFLSRFDFALDVKTSRLWLFGMAGGGTAASTGGGR